MDDFQRRSLDIANSSTYLAQFARTGRNILGIDYYSYSTTMLNVTSAASATSLIQIQSDSDFVLVYLSGTMLITSSQIPPTFNSATVQIQDTGTGKTFFNQPALMGLVFGVGGYPFTLPSPRVIAPNTNVKFDVTNLLAVAQDFYITMQGARIYYSS